MRGLSRGVALLRSSILLYLEGGTTDHGKQTEYVALETCVTLHVSCTFSSENIVSRNARVQFWLNPHAD